MIDALKKYALMAGIVVSGISLVILAVTENTARSSNNSLSDGHAVKIVIRTPANNKLVFYIPKEYLRLVPREELGDERTSESLSIAATLSHLESLPEADKTTADPDAVSVYLRSYNYKYDVNKVIELNSLQEWVSLGKTLDGFYLYVSRRDKEKYRENAPLINEFLIPVATASPSIFFECYKEIPAIPTGCSAATNYRDGLGLEYVFRRTELGRWKEIDQRVRELLGKFLLQATP
jgi:hypothetical protein